MSEKWDYELDNLYERAKDRMSDFQFEGEEWDFIFSDWPNWKEHLEWLLTASREEICRWIDASR